MERMRGKVAVVTGGGRGIGEAIVRRFLREGARGVVILEIDKEVGETTARSCDPDGERVVAIQCNVAVRDQVTEAFAEAIRRFGTVDILVNNAGIIRDAMFHKMTEEQWDAVIAVNLKGAYYCTKQAVEVMREKKYGKIVNISSTSARGNIGQANYAASKAALIGLTKTLAKELARYGITVNAVLPGMIDTDMIKSVPQQILEQFVNMVPMRRLGTADEVAAVVAFLASDDASFVTGETLLVCGGMLM